MVGTGQISRDPRTKRIDNDSLGLQNTLAIVYWPISTYTSTKRPHTHLQYSTRQLANTRFHESTFFFRPAFSLLQALIFSLNISKFVGGMHGHQAIVSFLSQVTAGDRGALPWETLNDSICW